MAQARWTGLSMGGPTYVEDPRVQESIALGELLLRNRAAAQTQADRLFQRKQDTADSDERRRQFNEEQKRLGDAQKMQAADSERRAGLEQQRLMQDQAQFGASQQGAAEDRLFRRDELAARSADRTSDNARAEEAREREAMDEHYRRADEARKAREFAVAQEQRAYHAQAERDAGQANQREKELMAADLRDARRSDAARARQREEIEAAAAREKKEATEREEKVLGTEKEQRQVAIDARAARFREALEEEKTQKGGRLSDADQAKAVQRAHRRATQPADDPERLTRETHLLGPEGEAESNAQMAAIAAEVFPDETKLRSVISDAEAEKRLRASPLGSAFDLEVIDNTLNQFGNELPEWVRDMIGKGRGFNAGKAPSAGRREADRLFKRK